MTEYNGNVVIEEKMDEFKKNIEGMSAIKKIKSPTTLLCELTRLKTQQKYLECTDVKLNMRGFRDTNNITSTTTVLSLQRNEHISTVIMFNEIKLIRIKLDKEMSIFRQQSRAVVNNIFFEVKKIKEDIKQEYLYKNSLGDIRQQTVSINAEIDELKSKNCNELSLLKQNPNYFLFNKQEFFNKKQ